MRIDDPGYCREVAGAYGAEGTWLAWVSWQADGERVRLRPLSCDLESWQGEPIDVCGPSPRGVTGTSLAAGPAGVLVAWSERKARGFSVWAHAIGRGMPLRVGQGNEPSVAFDTAGQAWVCWRGKTGVRLRSVWAKGAGRPLSHDARARRPCLAALRSGGLVCALERDAGIEVVRTDPQGIVRARRLLTAGGVWHHAPSVAVAEDGRIWVAWHANAALADGEPDIPKWVVCVALDGNRLVPLAPMAEMRDRDLEKAGVDQCSEFPTIASQRGGAITIFSRGSHCFYRQDLTAAGWGPLDPLGAIDWGCRGRRMVAVPLPSGRLVTARRERSGIIVEVLAGAEPAAPLLAPLPAPSTVPTRTPTRPRDIRMRTGRNFILFGDLHQHSAHSDGTGTADERYRRAREHYRDDFCALSDHESFLGKRTGPGEWSLLEEVAERHHVAGKFATIFAYEWTAAAHPGPGHKVVYLPRPGRPLLSRDDPNTKTSASLLLRVRELGGLAFPHHVGWTGADVAAHDPRVQTCWELCSCHGCYEFQGNEPIGHRGAIEGQFIRENLDRGLRFGLVASSDGHGLIYHHGIARKRDPFRTGLTAVLAPSVGRAEVLAALRARRCYATSGVKIGLDWTANGRPMGSRLIAARARLHARVTGTAELSSVSVITNGGVLHEADRRQIEGHRATLDLTVALPLDRPWAYYYLRVVQADGEMAWSSPCWVERPRSGAR